MTVRRLNRAEYNNTIRDLLGVDFQPADDFPRTSRLRLRQHRRRPLHDAAALRSAISGRRRIDPAKGDRRSRNSPPKDIRLQGLRVSRGAGEETNGGGVLYGEGEAGNEQFLDAGDYNIHVEVYAKQVGDEKVRAAIRLNREMVKEFEVTSTSRNQLQVLEGQSSRPAGSARAGRRFPQSLCRPRLIPTNPESPIAFRPQHRG